MSETAPKSMRITHVELQNWRNFTQVQVDLQRRVFLVGPNASGKSNFLDVFRFLRDLVTVGGGFQEAVRQRGGVSRLRCLAARRYPDILVKVHIGSDESPHTWEYEVRFKQDTLKRPIIKQERVLRQGEQILLRPDDNDQSDPERLTQTYLEQVNANQEFRDIATFFGSVQYLHIVPQLIRDTGRSIGKSSDPYGGDFLEQIARTHERTRNAWLKRIQNALRVAVPQLQELELWKDVRGIPHLRGKYEHWRRRGAWQTEEQFSDGTLRLLGLLWITLAGKGPLLLEEPELSLHSEVVRHISQMLARMQRRSGRQVLISTHSLDLLRDEGIGLDEVLLLQPGDKGTSVHPASVLEDIQSLLDGGSTLGEVLLPRSRPEKVSQLTLFGD